MENTFNPYTITWAILSPIKGKVTKKDLTVMFRAGVYTYNKDRSFNYVNAHFPTKEKANQVIKSIKGLSKNYEVIYITDKQFGLSKWNQNLLELATKKQLQDRFFI